MVADISRELAADLLRAGRVEADADTFTVSWWRRVPRRDGGTAYVPDRRQRDDEGDLNDPHETHTLASLAAEVAAQRIRTSAKGSGAALCGAAFRFVRDADRYHATDPAVRELALAELDVDTKAHDAAPPTIRDALDALGAMDLGAIVHASPSSTVGGDRAVRWRGWVRVAAPDGSPLVRGPSQHAADLNNALRCAAVCWRALLRGNVDVGVARGAALGFVNATTPAALESVFAHESRGALDPFAVRDAAVAAGVWLPYQRGMAQGVADGGALLDLVREVDAVDAGTLGSNKGGVYEVRCPLAHLHTDGRGRGADSSCVVKPAEGLLFCSHSHEGRGNLGARAMVDAWCEAHPSIATRLRARLSSATTPRAADVAEETFAGEPGDTSDPRITWVRDPTTGSAWRELAGVDDAGAEVADLLRRALRSWERGERVAHLLIAPTGVGKSAIMGAALAALAPPLPGDVDEREDTARPVAVYIVETTSAQRDAVARIDTAELDAPRFASAGLVPIRRGRHGAALRAAAYIPASAVSVDGRDLRNAGAEVWNDDAAHACAHWRKAEDLESRGVAARTSLCEFAGTDVPSLLGRVGASDGAPRACPRLAGGCPAAARYHYADGSVPAVGDAWVAVATGAAAHTVPPAVLGAPHIVDETGRATEARAYEVQPHHVGPDSPAAALAVALAGDRPGAEVRHRDSARAVYQGVLAWLREGGIGAMIAAHAKPEGGRADVLVQWLAQWSRRDPIAEGVRTATQAWATLAPARPSGACAVRARARICTGAACELGEVGAAAREMIESCEADAGAVMVCEADASRCEMDVDALQHLQRARAALALWRRARPVVARWGKVMVSEAARGVAPSAAVWSAVAAWLDGCEVAPHEHTGHDETGAWTSTRSGGAVVYAWAPPLVCARQWIERGPVVPLDATGDASLVASALRAGDAGCAVTGVRALALTIPDRAEVSRVLVRTSRATRSILVRPDKSVNWRDRKGAAVATIVRAMVATLLRAAPRVEGADEIAPVVVLAPQGLSRALWALAENVSPDEVRAGTHACVMRGTRGPGPLDEVSRAAIARSVAECPDEVRADLSDLLSRCKRVWFSWDGSDTARGSNAPHEAGARTVVTIGDWFVPLGESARRAMLARRTGDDAPRRQQRGDSSRALAQAHGRIRLRLVAGPVLLLHFGTVRPLDWRPADVEICTLDAVRVRPPRAVVSVPVEVPVADGAMASVAVDLAVSPTVAEPLRRAALAGWTRTAVARVCGTTDRTVRRWYAGDTPRGDALAPLAAALAAADAGVRAAYRALLLPGRRTRELVRGKSGARGILAHTAIAAGNIARAQRTGDLAAPRVRALTIADLTVDAFGAWVEGRVDLPADVVAALAAVAPAMRAEWLDGTGGARAHRARVAEVATRAQRASVSGDLPALGAADAVTLDALVCAEVPADEAPRGSAPVAEVAARLAAALTMDHPDEVHRGAVGAA